MNKVQIYILEEHNEAYLIWYYAIHEGLIKKCKNILLHIDQHADMDLPIFNTSIRYRNDSLKEIQKFTYEELSISNFIVPAVYEGIFKTVYWANHGYFKKNDTTGYILYSLGENGKAFSLKEDIPVNSVRAGADRKRFDYRILTLWDDIGETRDILLDIDLDFFSCIKIPLPSAEMEVTKKEYDRFLRNRYHFLKLKTDYMVKAVKRKSSYFLVFNDLKDKVPFGLEVSDEKILFRIDMLKKFLIRNRIVPAIVTVCRSRYSNFTPQDRWEFIERNLVDSLKDVYGDLSERETSRPKNVPFPIGVEIHGIDEFVAS